MHAHYHLKLNYYHYLLFLLHQHTPIMGVNTITTTLILFTATLLLYFSTVAIATDPCASQSDDSGIIVIPIYGSCSPFKNLSDSWDTTIIDMASKDPLRVEYLFGLDASLRKKRVSSAPIASGQAFNIGNYVVRVKLGTPGQLFFMVLDTSTDEAWVPCSDCTGCSSSTTYSPQASTSYGGALACYSPRCAQARGSLPCSNTGSNACIFNQSYAGI